MRKGWLYKLFGQSTPRRLSKRDLIRRESAIGRQLFGPIPEGHQREFFYLGEHSWVWHETWRDDQGKLMSINTRYEIHKDRVIKVQDGQPNRLLDHAELQTLHQAVRWYRHLVAQQVYGQSA